MADALIGATGFVGTTLLRQRPFECRFHSRNIEDIVSRSFDLVVCAGAPAQKWIANREPEADRANIGVLVERLATVRCGTFVLISTVDVFNRPLGVDEETPVDESGLHSYGRHRRLLEKFAAERFPRHLIVRLPGLVGPGLRKNVIFDLLNKNNLDQIDSRSVFQFYPMVNLWYDVRRALEAGLSLVHLTAEPISVAEASGAGFGVPYERTLPGAAAAYDMRTRHAAEFSATGAYQYRKSDTIQAIRSYAQSEPTTVASAPRAAP
jgi:dTDP-4-dehydrorhamnose reductase